MDASIRINPKETPNYKKEGAMAVDIRIDGTSFNLTDYYDTDDNLATNSNQWVSGKV